MPRPVSFGPFTLDNESRQLLSGEDLRSPTVSRHHARIVIAGEIATLERSPIQLADGDQIRIGAFELTFRTLAAPGSTETQQ